MTTGLLKLRGPFEAWHAAAHLGSLRRGGREEPVLVLLGPGADGEHLEAALDVPVHSGVLPFLGVFEFGERRAWVYRAVRGLGLGHLIGEEPSTRLPPELVVTVIGRLVRIFAELGPRGWAHPGPSPSDVLIDECGRVWLTGFDSPFPPADTRRIPESGEAALVYRLGMLWDELWSGRGRDRRDEGERAMSSRADTSAVSKDVVQEVRGWLGRCLAREAVERPGLREIADALRGPIEREGLEEALRRWATTHVVRRAERVRRAGDVLRETGDGMLLSRDLMLVDEEVTDGGLGVPVDGGGHPGRAASGDPGGHVARRTTRLAFRSASILLVAVAFFFLGVGFLNEAIRRWTEPESEEVIVGDLVREVMPDPSGSVWATFTGGEGRWLSVRCGAVNADGAVVRIASQEGGICTVGTPSDRGDLETVIQVLGEGAFVCFEEDSVGCREVSEEPR